MSLEAAPAPAPNDFATRLAAVDATIASVEYALGEAEARAADTAELEDRLAKAEAERRKLQLGREASVRISLEREAQAQADARWKAVESARIAWAHGDKLVADLDTAANVFFSALDKLTEHTDAMREHENVIDASFWRSITWAYEIRESILQRNRTVRHVFMNSASNECSFNWRKLSSVYPAFSTVEKKPGVP